MDNDDLKVMTSAVVAGLIISIGVGTLVGVTVVADAEGASWEWWQIIAASILAIAGGMTGIPVGVFSAVRIFLYMGGS